MKKQRKLAGHTFACCKTLKTHTSVVLFDAHVVDLFVREDAM